MGGGDAFPGTGSQEPINNTYSVMLEKPEINVLITGFGPFPGPGGEQYTRNSSHEITKLMPSLLSSSNVLNVSSVNIHIVNPTAGEDDYIPTEYAEIRKRVKAMHTDYAQQVDLFVHLGMADGSHHVAVERTAFKEGMSSTWWSDSEEERYYITPDNAGKTIDDLGPCPWEGVPMGLSTSLHVDNIVQAANKALKKSHKHSKAMNSLTTVEYSSSEEKSESDLESDAEETVFNEIQKHKKGQKDKKKKKKKKGKKDKKHKNGSTPMPVLPHLEGGSYGCGFIYYESLAACFVNFRKRDVLFCHVPGELDKDNLERARDAVLAVIGAAVEELMERKTAEATAREEKSKKLQT